MLHSWLRWLLTNTTKHYTWHHVRLTKIDKLWDTLDRQTNRGRQAYRQREGREEIVKLKPACTHLIWLIHTWGLGKTQKAAICQPRCNRLWGRPHTVIYSLQIQALHWLSKREWTVFFLPTTLGSKCQEHLTTFLESQHRKAKKWANFVCIGFNEVLPWKCPCLWANLRHQGMA